jgi:hypothetical protein
VTGGAELALRAAREALRDARPSVNGVAAPGVGRAAGYRARQARRVIQAWQEVLAVEEEVRAAADQLGCW